MGDLYTMLLISLTSYYDATLPKFNWPGSTTSVTKPLIRQRFCSPFQKELCAERMRNPADSIEATPADLVSLAATGPLPHAPTPPQPMARHNDHAKTSYQFYRPP